MGRAALEILRDHGVATDAVQVHAHRPTGSVTVTLTDGQPTYEIVEDVAWDAMTWHSELARLARSARAICFGTLDQRDPQSHQAIVNFLDAASPACLRVLDVNFRQHFHAEEIVRASLARADVLKLNDEEVPVLRDYVGGVADVDAFLTTLRVRFDLQCVILTLGADGCRVIGDAGICHAVGKKQRVVIPWARAMRLRRHSHCICTMARPCKPAPNRPMPWVVLSPRKTAACQRCPRGFEFLISCQLSGRFLRLIRISNYAHCARVRGTTRSQWQRPGRAERLCRDQANKKGLGAFVEIHAAYAHQKRFDGPYNHN